MNDRKTMTIRTALRIAKQYEGKGKGGIIQAAETLRSAYLFLLKEKKNGERHNPLIPKGWKGIEFKKLRK